jgi:hypothetical protein
VYLLVTDIVLQLLRRENFTRGEKVIMVDLVSFRPLLYLQTTDMLYADMKTCVCSHGNMACVIMSSESPGHCLDQRRSSNLVCCEA